MNFIELSSFIGEPQGYADFPEFQDDIWPLLKRKSKEIEKVFLFINGGSRYLDWPGSFEHVTKNILSIKPLNELTDRELSRVELLSFYGGHFNVLYRVSAESSLPRELCKLYPSVQYGSDDIDQLGIGPESLTELRWFTAGLPKEVLHFSFAHDGDPLFIFGELEVLRSLLQSF